MQENVINKIYIDGEFVTRTAQNSPTCSIPPPGK
jgi:hypothetical protein